MSEYAWEFRVLSDDRRLSNLRLEHLPDTCFWKSRLQNMFLHRELWDSIGFVNHGVYILSGPVGSGRHMTGSALTGELPVQYGTEAEKTLILLLRAEDFPESMTAEEAAAQVYAIFEECEGAPLSLVIFDAMGQYAHLPAVSNAIADCVDAHDPEDGNLAVICYVEDASKLSFDLRSLALILRTNEPNERQRAEFFDANLNWELPDPSAPNTTIEARLSFDNLSVEEIVAETQGFSYGDLALFIRYVRLSALDRVTAGAGMLLMYCSENAVRACLDTVKNKKCEAVSPIIQLQQFAGAAAQNAGSDADNGAASRATKLSGKTRSFDENLELIGLVSASDETENRKG